MSKETERRKKLLSNAKEMMEASEDARKAAPAKGNKGTILKLPKGITFFQPKIDKNYRLVFFPWVAGPGNHRYKKGEEHGTWNRYLKVHKNAGPNGEGYNCPMELVKKPCPICDAFAEMKVHVERGDKTGWNKIKDMRPKAREFFLVHDLDGDKGNLQVWEESPSLFGDDLRTKTEKTKFSGFASIEGGMVVEVKGKEKKIESFSCCECVVTDMEKLDKPLPDALIDKGLSLDPDSWVTEPAYDMLLALVGKVDGGVDHEEEPEKPEDEEPEEPSDEEDEPGPKKPAPKKPEPEEEEDDDSEEDSDDEDDDDETDEDDEEPEPKKPAPKPVKRK